MVEVIFRDLGLSPYGEIWDYQEKIFKDTIQQKIVNRDHPENPVTTKNYLLFCEHPHVYTLGKSGDAAHLLLDDKGLKENEVEYFKTNRGGDITYHGPGQLVGYPILDLDHFFSDIHKYLRYLEEAVIKTLAVYGITGGRVDGLTGVWIEGDNPLKARKICAMGVRCSRWVTMHGFAFNISTDLNYFNNIVPCGISDKAVTSLEKEIGYAPDMEEVKKWMKQHLEELFEMKLVEE